MDSTHLIRRFAHDIRNPLGAADGRADLLIAGIAGELAADQADHIEAIRRLLRTSLNLVDMLVEFVRADARQIELHLHDVDPAVLARDAADRHRNAAAARDLELINECDHSVRVSSDPDRVQQILSALLSNAIRYTTEGSVRLCVDQPTPDEVSDSAAVVAIRVSDTGRGIPAERVGDVFEPFTCLDRRDRSGSGLSLAVSRRLARMLGGDLTAVSEEGVGSTFTLLLPGSAPEPEEV